jgi:hypothetical protein
LHIAIFVQLRAEGSDAIVDNAFGGHVRRPMAHFFMGDPDDAETASYPVSLFSQEIQNGRHASDGFQFGL